ncbi:MAG: LCP family protein [Anaerolineae bacterium]|nr:LCP family protein [Anaerolineae bacterium]
MQCRMRLIVSVGLFLIVAGFLALNGIAPGGVFAALQATAPPTNTPRATIPPTNTPRVSPTPVTPTGTAVPTDTPTLTPSNTPTATATPTATDTSTPTATHTPSITPSPTATFTPTNTPTITPTYTPTFPPTPTLLYPPEFTPQSPLTTAIPTALPRLRSYDTSGTPYRLLNILLIGNDGDVIPGDPSFNTDTMIIVSINRDTNTVSMVSLPRDLYVYIPNWTMQRLNLAYGRGEAIGWTDGGWGLIRQTVLYNFGIELHYYAMVDFEGFEEIINSLGGVDIAVDCPIEDYRYQGPGEDGVPGEEDYELWTIPVGVHHMDGDLALWYARSRRNTIDFDRGRRQQQILRAIWATAKNSGLITQIPDLWDQMTSVVETNMPLSEIIPLLPLALSMEPNDITNHFFRKNVETMAWQPPDGSYVQLPDPNGGMLRLMEDFLTPPTANRLRLENARIEIFNGTGNESWDLVATDRLIWEGFVPQAMGQSENGPQPETVIYDYTGNSKGSSLNELVKYLNIQPDNIILEPDPNRTADFKIVLGENYNSCVDRQWVDPENLD